VRDSFAAIRKSLAPSTQRNSIPSKAYAGPNTRLGLATVMDSQRDHYGQMTSFCA